MGEALIVMVGNERCAVPMERVDEVWRYDGESLTILWLEADGQYRQHATSRHFPNFPIMPGVLIIEGLAQTAGALCVNNLAGAAEYKPQLVYFMGIDRAKFRKPVVPGDQLHYHVQKIRSRGRAWRFNGQAKVNGQIVAEAEISAMILDPEDAKR